MTTITRDITDQINHLYLTGYLSREQFDKADAIRDHWKNPANRNSIYINWAMRQDATLLIDPRNPISRLQICIDIIIQNHDVRQVEDWYQLRRGEAVNHLKAALDAYAAVRY